MGETSSLASWDDARCSLSQSLIIDDVNPLSRTGRRKKKEGADMLNSEITKPTHERSNESTICLDCELLADYKTCVSSRGK